MSKRSKFSWMIQPRGFVNLLGAEYELLRQEGGNVLLKFYIASLAISSIAVVSFISVRYAIELLFHIPVVEIVLSLFLSSLFLLLFIFLVNTFTKDARKRKFLNVSNVTRIGFVMFIGFIISKPIEAYIYKDVIKNDLAKYRQQLIEIHNAKIETLFSSDLAKLSKQIQYYGQMNGEVNFQREINQLNSRIADISNKKRMLSAVSAYRIEAGAYFIFRIRLISKSYPASWLISLLIVLLFLFPVYLIYSISSDDEYFTKKNAREKEIVENDYEAFCDKYEEIFLSKYSMKITFFSRYIDPPFNTTLKPGPNCQSSDEFHQRYAT